LVGDSFVIAGKFVTECLEMLLLFEEGIVEKSKVENLRTELLLAVEEGLVCFLEGGDWVELCLHSIK